MVCVHMLLVVNVAIQVCVRAAGILPRIIRSRLLWRTDTSHQFSSVQFSYVLHPFAARYSHWMWHSVEAVVVAMSRQCHGIHQPMCPADCAQTKLGEQLESHQ